MTRWRLPRVAPLAQPWAELRSPLGAWEDGDYPGCSWRQRNFLRHDIRSYSDSIPPTLLERRVPGQGVLPLLERILI